jgi:ABC-type branched-subunit amino acid transport system permease subunit
MILSWLTAITTQEPVHTTGVNADLVAAIVSIVAIVVGFFAWIVKVTLGKRLDDQDEKIDKLGSDAETARAAAVVTSMSVARIEGWLSAQAGRPNGTLPAVDPHPDPTPTS